MRDLPVNDEAVRGLSFERQDLSEMALEFTEIDGCTFVDTDLSAARWRRAMIADSTYESCDLANLVLDESGIQRVSIDRSRLTGLTLAGCTVQNLVVRESAADLANMRFAKLKDVVFDGCRLTGTDWTGARLDGVRFTDCDLTDAQFSQVTVQAARFEQCIMDGISGVASLTGSVIDPVNLLGLSQQLADALGITIAPLED